MMNYLSGFQKAVTWLAIGIFLVCEKPAFASQITVKRQLIEHPRGIVEGTFANGLHYIILPNELPRHDVEVRLVMRVGSLHENDRQKGSAHFLEHSAFTGTKHFPGHTLIDYFERQGMKFGRDINAFTGFDRTIYWLSLPMEKTDSHVLDSAFLAVKDWLTAISFDSERVKKECSVIAEELRGYSTGDDFYPLKIGKGRYAQRMPLGTEDDIRHIDSATLQAFHSEWYAPQLATVVVVGNIDTEKTVDMLQRNLSSIPRKPLRRWSTYSFDYPKGTSWQEVRDTMQTSTKLEIIVPHRTTVVHSIASAVQKQQMDLLITCLSNRLNALKTGCDVSNNWYLGDKDHFVLSFSAKDKTTLLHQITATAREFRRLSQNSFCPGELEIGINSRLGQLTPDTTQRLSTDLCDDFTDYIMTGDRPLRAPEDVNKVRALLKKTDHKLLQKLLRNLIGNLRQCRLLAYTNPCMPNEIPLTAHEVDRAWLTGWRQTMHDYYDFHPNIVEEKPVIVPPCLAEKHTFDAQQIASRTSYADLGVTEIKLLNGLRILLRPTLEEEQTLSITALGRGGTADLSDCDYRKYHDAVSYVDMGGLEKVHSDTLLAVMNQEKLSMVVGEDDYWHQVLASAPVAKTTELFNMVYEKMCHPGLNRTDFAETCQAEAEGLGKETLLERLMQHDAERMINNRIDSLTGNALSGRRPKLTKNDIDALDIDTLTQYYRRLFADPSQLTIILTGHFPMEETARIAISTFARMKRSNDAVTFKDTPFALPATSHTETFDGGNDDQTVLNYVFAGNYQPSLRASLRLKLMRDILQDRLIRILRERENIVYSPFADLYYSGCPQQVYHFQLTISVKNANRTRADHVLDSIIEELKQHPVSASELDKMKRSFIVTKRKTLSDKAPSEWKTALTSLIRNGESLADFDNYASCLDTITPEDIRQGFVNYLQWNKKFLLIKSQNNVNP